MIAAGEPDSSGHGSPLLGSADELLVFLDQLSDEAKLMARRDTSDAMRLRRIHKALSVLVREQRALI